jgi:hypothetical protein
VKLTFREFFIIIITLIPLSPLQSQETAEQEVGKLYFLPALGLNLFSNAVLYLADRYIVQAPWAQISFGSIKTNFTSPWDWDGDEYFTNQFLHPYHGSFYHASARSNGFTFYESLLFDAFGSASWELIFETNAPSINDLISTSIGGASLGEIFHRLYLEIPSPFAVLISPADALNGLITGRRPNRKTTNIHSLDVIYGIGYIYSRQSTGKFREDKLIPLMETHSVSTGISCNVVYGNPFIQQSLMPYNHFELSIYADIAYPFWYNLNIQSHGYLFSFNIIDNEKSAASTGLSLHYDLFTDRHINFFGESLDWTFKYTRIFNNSRNIEFKGHLGGTVFNADNSYFFGEYSNLRQNENNYGTGVNIKIFVSKAHRKWGKMTFNTSVYEIFSVFRNNRTDSPDILFLFSDLSYIYPLGDYLSIGIAVSVFRNTTISDFLKDTEKGSYAAKLFINWSYPKGSYE